MWQVTGGGMGLHRAELVGAQLVVYHKGMGAGTESTAQRIAGLGCKRHAMQNQTTFSNTTPPLTLASHSTRGDLGGSCCCSCCCCKAQEQARRGEK